NGDVPRADTETPWRVDDSNCAHHVLQVCEGFAHSHEDNVVDLLAAFPFRRDNLIDNFVLPQIARESFQTARAKFASVSATNLARLTRETSRPALPIAKT